MVGKISFTKRVEHERGRGGRIPQLLTGYAITRSGADEARKSLDFYRSNGEHLTAPAILAAPRAGAALLANGGGERILGRTLTDAPRAANEKERARLLSKASPEFKLCLRALWDGGLSPKEIETLNFADWVPGANSVNFADGRRVCRHVAVTPAMRACFDEAREMHLWGLVFGTVEGRRFTRPTLSQLIASARSRAGAGVRCGPDVQFFDHRRGYREPGQQLLKLMPTEFQRFYRAWKSRPAALDRDAVADLVWQMVDVPAKSVRPKRGAPPVQAGAEFLEEIRKAEQARDARPLIRTPDHRRWTGANIHAAFKRLKVAADVPSHVVLQGSGRRHWTPDVLTIATTSGPRSIVAQSDHIQLCGPDDPFLVDGVAEPRLAPAQYEVLRKLVLARARLSFDEMGGVKAHRALTRLRADRPRVTQYLLLPQKRGDGYGVR
jgi:hypothetical protein